LTTQAMKQQTKLKVQDQMQINVMNMEDGTFFVDSK
jgi:hypothetical protein